MRFPLKNLYGWGVCRIPMPRSSKDIFADRRKRDLGSEGEERRHAIFFQSFPVIGINALRRDFPAGRALGAVCFGVVCIILLSMTGMLIPKVAEEPPAQVEITARLLEEPLPAIPEPVPPPIVAREEPVAEPPPKTVPPPPKPTVAAVAPRELLREPPPAKVEILKPAPAKTEPRLPAPRATTRLTRESPLVSQPKMVANLKAPPKPDVNLPKPETAARNYDSRATTAVSLPKTGGPTMESKVVPRISLPRPTNSLAGDSRFKADSGNPQPLPRERSFSPAAAGTTVDLPEATGLKKNLGRPRSLGDAGVPVTGSTFSPPKGGRQVALGPSTSVGGNYRGTTGDRDAFPAPVGNRDIVGGIGGDSSQRTVDIPAASGSGLRTASGSSRGLETRSGSPPDDFRFVGAGSGKADPSLWVSLNQLDACIDQNEEDRLRTELATLLEREDQCRAGDMIFDFKYPESGWTMQVNLYNPVEFADKCAALAAAIECIHHSKQ